MNQQDNEKKQDSLIEESTPFAIKKSALVRFNWNDIFPKTSVIKLNDVENDLKPLYIMPPTEGNAESLRQLATYLPCPVYGFQCENLSLDILYSWSDMLRNSGLPCRLAGYGNGGFMAIFMGLKLDYDNLKGGANLESLTILDGCYDMEERILQDYKKTFKPSFESEVKAIKMLMLLKQFLEVEDSVVYQQLSQFDDVEEVVNFSVDMLMKTGVFPCRDSLWHRADNFLGLLHLSKICKLKYADDILLIKAKESFMRRIVESEDYDLGLDTTGFIKVVEVDGDHESFIVDDGAKRVAEIMTPILS